MKLKGKSAIVTGSTSGIGLGIARALAAEGCNITINGFGEPSVVEAERKGIESDFAVSARYSDADVSKAAEIEKMVKDSAAAFGGVDILVNNAGFQYPAPIEDFPNETWEGIIATNLSSVFYGMKYALPLMKAKGWGRIINTSSVHGLVASANKTGYVAAKHGVIGLTKTVALECAGSGITCNAICPGWVLTPLVQKQIDAIAAKENISNEQASKKLLLEKQPSGAFATPEQIGAFAVFLCGDAAAQITGASLTIDGGWTAQ